MIRSQFWINDLRRIVTNIDVKCKTCAIKRNNIENQLMGNLPEFRFQPSVAFSAVCMDLFGPIIIKDDGLSNDLNTNIQAQSFEFTVKIIL